MAFQGFGPVYQLGYLVEDIEASMRQWVADLHVGPWLYLPHLAIHNFVYAGEPSTPDISLALSFTGQLQVELIQQHNEAPSLYQDWKREGRYGAHHLGYVTRQYEAGLARALAYGYRLRQSGETGTRGGFAYLSTGAPQQPQMLIELIDIAKGRDRLFQAIAEAVATWDGTDPIRREIPV